MTSIALNERNDTSMVGLVEFLRQLQPATSMRGGLRGQARQPQLRGQTLRRNGGGRLTRTMDEASLAFQSVLGKRVYSDQPYSALFSRLCECFGCPRLGKAPKVRPGRPRAKLGRCGDLASALAEFYRRSGGTSIRSSRRVRREYATFPSGETRPTIISLLICTSDGGIALGSLAARSILTMMLCPGSITIVEPRTN